jgi:hypothetical protein
VRVQVRRLHLEHLPPDGARVVALGCGEDGVAQGQGALVALEEGLERDVEGVAVGVVEALEVLLEGQRQQPLRLGQRVLLALLGRDRLEHELATLGQLDVVQRGGREARLADGQLGVGVDDGRSAAHLAPAHQHAVAPRQPKRLERVRMHLHERGVGGLTGGDGESQARGQGLIFPVGQSRALLWRRRLTTCRHLRRHTCLPTAQTNEGTARARGLDYGRPRAAPLPDC